MNVGRDCKRAVITVRESDEFVVAVVAKDVSPRTLRVGDVMTRDVLARKLFDIAGSIRNGQMVENALRP